MTQKVDAILTLPSELKCSTPQLAELDQALTHAGRTAGYFVRQRQRQRDSFFLQEMRAEAYFIVTQLILAPKEDGISPYDRIVEKFPVEEDRFKFYRMTVGYGLKAYCAYRAMRTISYLRRKGILEKHIHLEDEYVPCNDHAAIMNIMVDEAARTPMEKQVLQFYCMGNPIEVISQKVGLEPKRVKKVMRRIKRRLKE